MRTLLAICVGAVLGSSLPATALSASLFRDIQQAVEQGDAQLDLRYRYERVDQDGVAKEANASTLRTRIKLATGNVANWRAVLEADDITSLGNDNYNSTVNGKITYPVVADPTGTEVNQAFIEYQGEAMTFSAGRQRINHAHERFVGGVGWRQNEQTFDGYRLQYQKDAFHADYAYVHNVNRIFGENSAAGDLPGEIHLFNTSYTISNSHQIWGYIYNMDFDYAAVLSNRTLGVAYQGKLGPVTIYSAYATQSEEGENPRDYQADYFNLQASVMLSPITVTAGYESLGSDNGKGFITPLATLHKFQGFADKFLSTPEKGVNDTFVKVAGKLQNAALSATWHTFTSEVGSADYGSELDLTASYPLAQNVGLTMKYANYNADEFATDTNKFWMMVNASF